METVTMHKIQGISFEENSMILNVDGQVIKIQLSEVSEKLLKASEIERKNYRISPSGYGIHWYQLDEDLSLNGLLNQQSSRSV